jgi:hypothetical protein
MASGILISGEPYPGVNAVTLMEMSEPVDARQAELIPIVRYAVKRRVASRLADYWDHATILELSVLGRDRGAAKDSLSDTLVAIREPWEPETTARNLRLIYEIRARRGEDVGWIQTIESELRAKATNSIVSQ